MATLLDELLQLISALNENEIEYAVCGGLSMAIHGFARASLDIDVLIRAESLEKAYEIAARYGYDIRGLDRSFKERAVEIRRVSKIDDDGEVLMLDYLLNAAAGGRRLGNERNFELAGQKFMDRLARRFNKNEKTRGQSERFD